MIFYNCSLRDNEIYLNLTGTFEADLQRKWVPYYSFDNFYTAFCKIMVSLSMLIST